MNMYGNALLNQGGSISKKRNSYCFIYRLHRLCNADGEIVRKEVISAPWSNFCEEYKQDLNTVAQNHRHTMHSQALWFYEMAWLMEFILIVSDLIFPLWIHLQEARSPCNEQGVSFQSILCFDMVAMPD